MIKAWKVYWQHPVSGACVKWKTSRREAESRLNRAKKEIREDHGKGVSMEPYGFHPIEIPTRRFELIDWLNENTGANE